MMLSEFPFFNSQQLNLDWILEKLAAMENSFVPYVKLDAISADSDAALVSAFNSKVDQIPLGFSVLHFGAPNEDALQVFAFCYRTDTDSGTANIYTTGTSITLSVLNMADGVWVAGAAPEYGTTVVANPTLAGTEADLTGLQVGDTKYKVPAGGGGGVLVVHEDENRTLDKTWQEIANAIASTGAVLVYENGDGEMGAVGRFLSASAADPPIIMSYRVTFADLGSNQIVVFTASSASGYPTMAENDAPVL